ncbi:hypothetical protein [Nocardia sp. BMG51109]|uniref:hypothetical protein n=1 Tax=Nocardia sp. BMG51109 TaxID=1056816 RepID=UPI0012EB3CAD|nr:hypothetical protein [Nocardia sp. BMG51109]
MNESDATAFKSEMSASSAAATSSRQAAAQAQAITDNCSPFRDLSGVAVAKYNEFVDAHDANAPDQDAKRDASAETLENAARTVEGRVTASGEALPVDLSQKFTAYVTAARELATEARKMTYTAPVGPLNDASNRVNDALNTVRNSCPNR